MHGANADEWLSSLLDEAEEIIWLHPFRKQSAVFSVSEPLFVAALQVIPEILTEWEEDLRMASPHLKGLLAAYCPLLSDSLFARLLAEGYSAELFTNPSLSDEVRASLVPVLTSHPNPRTRFALARHPHIRLGDLEVLAHDRRPMVREMVASHPQLSTALAELLASDVFPSVRAAVGSNVCTPEPLLARLLADPVPNVRAAVAQNPGLSSETLLALFAEPAEKMRAGLAANPSLPVKLFWELAADPSPVIQQSLAANPCVAEEILSGLLRTEEVPVWEALARNSQATASMLTWLAQKGLSGVCEAIAQNAQTPPDLLRQLPQLVENASQTFWRALATHEQTPVDVLRTLLADRGDDPTLLFHILNRPELADERDRLLFAHFLCVLNREIQQRGTSRFKLLLVTHPEVPPAVLEAFARSERWEERYLVARHARAPLPLLQSLQEDPHVRVREAARKRFS
ncbi:MAG TPA: hypothetical protein VFV38_44485 [Ktedonobacteraceae bacterium]|nr:hypothetical protein [Ktedonobacteraceae bacterium]